MKRQMLTVVMHNSWRTHLTLTQENEWVPHERRTIHIPLTDGQMAMLTPRCVGASGTKEMHEVIGEVWLEDAPDEGP